MNTAPECPKLLHAMFPGCVVEWRCALVACLLVFLPVTVLADVDRVEEVVVTARKIEEPLARVPLSIYAFDRESFDAEGIDSLQSLISRAPGLYFESAFGGLVASPTIRAQPSNATGASNVGVFVDGVYQAEDTAMDVEPLDLERVEVIFGPQSTLFGHNTYAGAIQFVGASPTEIFTSGASVESGTDEYRAASGFVSGPLFEDRLLVRAALGFRSFDGTDLNHAPDGSSLGGWERSSAVLKVALPSSDGFSMSLSGRISRVESKQSGVSALNYQQYNCGGIEPSAGAWSYFCGDVPLDRYFDVSPGIPDSRSDVAQLSLVTSSPWLGGELTSQTSVYRGETDLYRDFDASSTGEKFGVCTIGVNCTVLPGALHQVDALSSANEVFRQEPSTDEWSQELRWIGRLGTNVEWMLGAVAYWTTIRDRTLLGVTRGELGADQRFTSFLPSTPLLVGPLALQNFAIVVNPNASQITQSRDVQDDRTLAVFGYVDYQLTTRLGVRTELRAARQRARVDNRVANYQPGFGDSLPSEEFDDVTPRFSVEYAASDTLRGYVSAAKGSQEGGINPIPGLLSSEQSFDPEYNWTYEVGGRYVDASNRRSLSVTYFHVEQYDTQLLGFSDTPGIANLITRNVDGSRVNGVEVSMDVQWSPWVRVEAQYAYDSSEFNSGTDDPGSRRLCGLRGLVATSSFCDVGPSRSGSIAMVVPYIDGNQSARVPRTMWHAAVVVDVPPFEGGGRMNVRMDTNGQDDVFERSIAGASYGARTLFDARISYELHDWTISLWGRNLTDEEYIRAAASRPAIYYATVPRPLDFIYGDGRRVGVTISYSISRDLRH